MIRKAVQWTCVFAFAGLMASAQTGTPVTPIPILRTFGMVGLAEGQIARLNLLNPEMPAPGATAAMCSAAVSFIDATGTVLKSTTIAVSPGQSQEYDLDSDADLNLPVDQRREIRATIQIQQVASGTTPAARCRLVPTLEIFDTLTGRTEVVVARAHAVKDAEPAAAN